MKTAWRQWDSRLRGMLGCSVAALAMMAGGQVHAQEASQQAPADANSAVGVEDIIVTAQRRQESLIEVPISITAFSAASLDKNMVDGVEDYFRRSPNVFITDGATRSGNVSQSELSLAIRGVSNVGGISSSFGAYVDDFNVTRATLNPHLVDVERIEVLRGPQGTFFGRNASGGVFAIYTKRPVDKFEANVGIQAARFDTYELQGMVNVPVSDKFYVRVAGKLAQSDGNMRNVNPIGGNNGYDHQFVRVSTRFVPTDQLTIDLNFSYTNEKQNDLGLVHTGVVSGFINSICAPPVVCPADTANGFYPANKRFYNHDFPLRVEDKYWMTTGKIEYVGEGVTLTNVAGYISTKFNRRGELDFSSFDFLREEYNTKDRTAFSEELRVQSNGSGPFQWTVGGVYAIDTEERTERINIGSQNGLGLPNLFPIEISGEDIKVVSRAIFGEASYEFANALTITAGLRWSRDTQKQTSSLIDFGTDNGSVTDRNSYSNIAPRVVLSYKPGRDVNVYASVSQGWKAGGFVHRPGSTINAFGDEKLWNYEAGVKASLLEGRIRTGLTMFYIDWRDIQVQSSIFITRPDGSIASVSAVSNGARAKSKGVEFEFSARPVRALELGFTLGYNDAHFTRFQRAVTSSGVVDLSGQPLPKAPKWSIGADAQYNIELGNDWEAFLRGEWQYKTKAFTNVNNIAFALAGNTFPFVVPKQSFVNLRAGVSSDRYKIAFYADNVFNKNTYTASYDFGFVNGAAVYPAYRSYGVRLNANF